MVMILQGAKTRTFWLVIPSINFNFGRKIPYFSNFGVKIQHFFFLSYRTICSFWSPASKLAKSAREREEGVQDFVKMKSMIALVLLSPKPFHLFYSGAQQ